MTNYSDRTGWAENERAHWCHGRSTRLVLVLLIGLENWVERTCVYATTDDFGNLVKVA